MLEIFENFSLPEIGRNYKQINPAGNESDVGVFFMASAILKAQVENRILAIFCKDLARIARLQAQLKWLIPEVNVAILPDWETLPYDRFSPHKELASERILSLYKLITGNCQVVLISASSALTKLANKEYFLANAFWLKVGDKFDKTKFSESLVKAGYHNVNQVISHGEWAVRGAIIDIYPVSSPSPCRIEQNDNVIESLRLFDPESQRTIHPINELNLLPAREFPFDENAIERFRQNFREKFAVNPANCPIYKSVSNKIIFAGAEYYLPLFCEYTATIFDYLPENAVYLFDSGVSEVLEDFQKLAIESFNAHNNDHTQPILPTNELFINTNEFAEKLTAKARITLVSASFEQSDKLLQRAINLYNADKNPQEINKDIKGRLNAIKTFNNWQKNINAPIFLWVESSGRASVIADLFRGENIPYKMLSDELGQTKSEIVNIINTFPNNNIKINLGVAPFIKGFENINPAFYWLTENELFPDSVGKFSGRNSGTRISKKSDLRIEQWVRDLVELAIGDLVVHQQYGIGRYQGLINLDYGDGENEFLHLEYAGNAKLYVPITQLHLIGRFSVSDNEQIRLHTLGSGEWEKTLAKAEKSARDSAAELLSLYALRHNKNAPQMQMDKLELEKFAEGFGFELTVDQESAIDAVVEDMTGNNVGGVVAILNLAKNDKENLAKSNSAKPPMDRLICGDVGFGKTEVAMRAAFVAINNGYQVALLCPTTLLAEQHGATFSDRFVTYGNQNQIPFNIVTLSRFRTSAEQKKAIGEISLGQVDLVIGTHRLLQNDINFKNLGLIIIDEEHRFGVRHKEALKKMRANAHILTMSATPIPRTLSFSLEGLRDFSVMSTPPSRRLAVKTMLGQYYPSLVRESALREFRRGGQVFFVHNEVQTIAAQYKKISEILPEARIAIAHGQMPEKELEQVMRAFRHYEYNFLLCTTIIENGIDIPNANTILINKAERFGIAQLHQLRGRVGRSHHQAYCYLLIEGYEKLAKASKQRLDALCAAEELGAGFYLAMHDLEIRGAGEILGESQSGAIEQIGFEFYLQMLTKASRELKKQGYINEQSWQKLDKFSSGECKEVNLHASAFIPDSYCADITERLKIYKRLASCETEEDISKIRSELGDRFGILRDGALPEQVENLIAVHRIRIKAKRLGIVKVDANNENINFYFNTAQGENPINLEKLLKILRHEPKWSLKSSDKIMLLIPTLKAVQRVSIINQAIATLETALD